MRLVQVQCQAGRASVWSVFGREEQGSVGFLLARLRMKQGLRERRGVEKGFGGWARTLSGVAGVRSEDDSIEGPFGRFSTASLALGCSVQRW